MNKSDRIRIKIENLLREFVRVIDADKEKKIRDESVRKKVDFEGLEKKKEKNLDGRHWESLTLLCLAIVMKEAALANGEIHFFLGYEFLFRVASRAPGYGGEGLAARSPERPR